MQYFVIWPDGQKFGPATLDTLNQWAGEGRITPDTLLESVVDGSQLKAGAVPGMVFAQAAPAAAAAAPAGQPTASAPRYFVVMPDGNKFGPADVPTLNQWAQEGRLSSTSNLEEEGTGRTLMAASLPGVSFAPANVVKDPVIPQQPTYQQPTTNYPRYETPVYGDAGKADFTKSIVCSILGIFCCGFIGSGLGLYFGNKAKAAGHPNGQTAVILAIVILVLNVIGTIVYVGMIGAGAATQGAPVSRPVP